MGTEIMGTEIMGEEAHQLDYLLVVGPGRSGTDYLFEQLRRHPQLAFPESKEGYYYRSLRRRRRAAARAGPGRTLADIANLAYRDPKLPARVRRLAGSGVRVLIVVLLRDHVARAQSMMLFRASRGEPSAWLGRRRLEERVVRDRLTAGQLAAIRDSGAEVMVVDFQDLTGDTGAVLDGLLARCRTGSSGRPGRIRVAKRVAVGPLDAPFGPGQAGGGAAAPDRRPSGPAARQGIAPSATALLPGPHRSTAAARAFADQPTAVG